ncbi:MAG: TlyA family RNA methyltransferase [Actinobacteria bacterium]|nr:TlyA family RNA methyltransferase [Actinomycetota bacterium]
MARQRIDIALVDRGLFESREKAQAAVLAGTVKADSVVVHKPGHQVDEGAVLEVSSALEFVSRGGLKLKGALETFGVDVAGRRAIDVGASTGGFTDCLLQRGATNVAAVDVGYGQLAWSLRNDPRVSVFERTNIRHVDPAVLGGPFELAVIDVSFISLTLVAAPVVSMLTPDAHLLALAKPQFEVGKGRVGKKGVVKDPALHVEVLHKVSEHVCGLGLRVAGICNSPIKGPEGNIEYWLWASNKGPCGESGIDIETTVADAHKTLGA